jgi:hypothetical protein
MTKVGGAVFKKALGDAEPIRDQRGTLDPLTGVRQMDPAYVDAQRETRRGRVLEQALRFQDQRERAQERMAQIQDTNATRAMIAGLKGESGGGGGGGRGHNLVQITHPTTGESWWADPRDGTPIKPVAIPGAAPFVKPDKMTPADEKDFSALTQDKAAIKGGVEAVQKYPGAFGFLKGVPNLVGGALGTVTQTARDKALSREEISARSYVYNNVSAIIKERAGTAQSAGELQLIRSFLPAPTDDGRAILAKFDAYNQYIAGKEKAIRSRYGHGGRPVSHLPGTQPVAPGAGTAPAPGAQPAPGAAPRRRVRLDPATGDLVEVR